ncbi:MAG: xanthine dehydrogenase family protein [Alphaproteobacteria bacterium]|nr:xanthine dehydrogenase family protein [Alphaproteobacteria bacterium]
MTRSAPTYDARFGPGQPAKRSEDFRLLTGAGRFSDDLNLPGQAHLVLLRAPHAHARIVRIDAAEAKRAPGVVAVYTGADLVAAGVGPIPTQPFFKRPGGKDQALPPRHALAVDAVHFAGEAVAAVVAESRIQAQDAAERILVDYAPLPVVTSAAAAAQPGAPQLHPAAPDNLGAEIQLGDKAKVDALFAAAAHVVRLDIHNQRVVPNAIEPRATLAEYDSKTGRLTVHLGVQNPTATRTVLADAVLKMPAAKVRVLVNDIGGGFGMKSGVYPEDVLCAFAARALERPVKWRAERGEEFLAATHGRDLTTSAALALDKDGKALALRVDSLVNVGGVLSASGTVLALGLSPLIATGVYAIPAVHQRVRSILTATGSTGAYRGAGRPEAIFIVERLMDGAARHLGLDPLAIRRRNFVPAAAMPYTSAMGQVYDSGDFARMLERARIASDWDGFEARRQASEAKGRLRGRGLSTYIEWTGARAHSEKVEVLVNGNGRVTVLSATQAMGQGLATSYAQLVAAALEVPFDSVDIVQGDTDLVQGFGSLGSRSAFVGGTAVQAATLATVERGKALAAEALETALADVEYRQGRFRIAGTDRGLGLYELAARQPGGLFRIDRTVEVGGPSWPNGCHVCEVEIDRDTGQVTLERYVTSDDVGNAINPMIVHGQIHGGIAQGAGQALFERAVYDPESGQLLTGSFMDYVMPRADDLPAFSIALDHSQPCRTNALGVKGAGESGTVAAPPAVINAVVDALAPFGIDHVDMPATSKKIWRLIRNRG